MDVRRRHLMPLVALAAFVSTAAAVAAQETAEITVTFTEDDMGFTASSSKDISNVIVELCDGTTHKHDNVNDPEFTHTETQKILGVWVKSGDNSAGDDAPPGAGERFDNEGVVCDEAPEEDGETPTETTAPDEGTDTDAPPGDEEPTPTAEIPFFPSGTALALGAVGAMGGAFLVMRRRN